MVDTAGPDMLRVRPGITGLCVNAPDTMTAGRWRSSTVSGCRMTRGAELFAAESGQVLARVIDRREARGSGSPTMTRSVGNA